MSVYFANPRKARKSIMANATSKKEELKKGLKYLAVLEAYNAIAFTALYFFWLKMFQKPFYLFSFYPVFICSVILMQGAVYWKICFDRLNRTPHSTQKTVRVYSAFRIVDCVLLLIFPVIAVLQWRYQTTGWLIFSMAMYVFAWIEYVNYYFIQLSYPVRPFFRRLVRLNFGKSQIAKEIQRSKKEQQ